MNISNSLSILRIILSIPVAVLLIDGNTTAALIVGTIAGITDFLDGYMARKLNQITELGKILDPIADKVFIGIIALVLVYLEIIPFWFFAMIIVRDLLILIGGLYAQKKYNYITTSNFEGKATYFLLLIVTAGLIVDLRIAYAYGIYLTVAALIYSFFVYVFRMIKDIKNM